MRNLIAYFVKFPITGNVLMFIILIFGAVGLSSLRSTFFPESDTKVIRISVPYPGASPEEVEEGVVNKIEDNLTGVSGIDRISSKSSENVGTITVEVANGYDIDLVLQDVKNQIDAIPSFPGGIEAPTIYKQETLNVALNFSVSGDVDLGTLKRYARQIEDDLLANPNISKVALSGFPDEEIEIALRENDLRSLGLTFNQVSLAVATANIDLTGGTIKSPKEELLVRTRSKGYRAEDLRGIIVATSPDGRRIYLEDIADIRDQWADAPDRTFVNGNPAVSINVQNTTSESLLEIADIVREYVDNFNQTHDDVQATIINDGSVLLNQRIDLLRNNGLIGFFLVLTLLAMFLRPSLAFWVAAAIPISFAGMFMIGAFIGLQINVISLFGMIIVIGILVDDGIVIAENIYSHWERGKEPLEAAVDGTMEVLPAVLSAILTTMIAFSTFFFLDGITGDFFVDIAIVVILSLAFSLVEGTFILPGHIAHSNALDRKQKKKTTVFDRIQDTLSKGMDWMRDKLYAPQLKAVFKYPILGLVAPISILMISFGLVAGGFVSITFFPVIEGDFTTVTLKMPAGTPEEQTMKWLRHIEDAAWEVNEELKSERPDGKDVINIVNLNMGPTTYDGNLLINMLDSEARGEYAPHKSSQALLKRIEEKAGPIDESESLTYALAGPFGKAVSVAIYGNDLDELDLAVAALKDSLKEDARLTNVESSDQKGLREINVRLKDKARLLGLDLQTVIGQVRSGFYGAEVQRLQRGEDEVKVWVRYAEVDRNSVGNLEEMYIRTSSGQNFPLKEIAYLEPTRGVISINHLDGLREIRVQADAANASVSTQDVLANIQNDIMPAIQDQFPSIKVSYEGQVRENTKFATSIQEVGPLILFLMLCMIVLTFRSFSQTLAVLATIPFALIGVFFGHWILIKPFSIILSGLGVLALIGIMVNDALVLVSQFNILIKNEKPFKEALYEASLSRFRPIFLTSVTTIAGLAPLILEKSLQAQFLIPMAITVAFGLAVATLLILVSLPSFLLMINWYKRSLVTLWTGEKPDPNEVEPASLNRKKFAGLYWIASFAIIALLVFLFSLG